MWVRNGYLSSSKKIAKQWSDKCYATVNTLSSENGLMISLIMGYNFQFVGNKAKGQLSRRVFQENRVRQIFQKTNISHLLIRTPRQVFQENKARQICVRTRG